MSQGGPAKPAVLRGFSAQEYFFEEGCFVSEWSNSPSDASLSIAHIRVPAGVTTQWHRLDGIAERYVILGGVGRVEVGVEPAVRVEVGDVVVIPSGERQRIHNAGPDDLVFLALCTPRFRPQAYVALSD
ncbi:MAG: cupin domain-containing protein [Rhodocyclaceae bacterium]